MLFEFLESHREAIVARVRARVAARRVPGAAAEVEDGVPLFVAHIAGLLRDEEEGSRQRPVPTTDEQIDALLGGNAAHHGDEMMRAGMTIAQVVEAYGDVCQAITEHATSRGFEITSAEYRTLNQCLDVATSRAVTAYLRERERSASRESTERLGMLAHELRNLLSTAMLSYEALKRGSVGVESLTGAVLGRSLQGLRDVVDRSLAQVRLAAALHSPERVVVAQFVEDVEVAAALDAKARGVELCVAPGEPWLAVQADRALLASALGNLLQNAIKFTPRGGRVTVTARLAPGHVLIDVADQCGGIPEGKLEELFRPFERHGADRTGLGLGLGISLEAVRANGGQIHVRNQPGEGCVFTIELPLSA
jgi:signal transduction histidine kinase